MALPTGVAVIYSRVSVTQDADSGVLTMCLTQDMIKGTVRQTVTSCYTLDITETTDDGLDVLTAANEARAAVLYA